MDNQNFWQLATAKQVTINAIKIAIIVGSILAIINYGDRIISGDMLSSDWIKLGFSYLVPYAVSTVSSVSAIKNCGTP